MIYPYRCSTCDGLKDIWQQLRDYVIAKNIPVCCGISMARVFTTPMIQTDYQKPFMSHIDGTIIESKMQQREHMAKHGVVLYDDLADDLPKIRAAASVEAFKDIKTDINEAIEKVVQGYEPIRSIASGDENSNDVIEIQVLPRDVKNNSLIEV